MKPMFITRWFVLLVAFVSMSCGGTSPTTGAYLPPTLTPDDAVRVGDAFRTTGTLELENGDLLEFHYGPISDSGVDLVCLDPANGEKRWTARCEPMRASHSKYKHEVAVRVEDGRLKVTSVGSAGWFMEWRQLDTGNLTIRVLQRNPNWWWADGQR